MHGVDIPLHLDEKRQALLINVGAFSRAWGLDLDSMLFHAENIYIERYLDTPTCMVLNYWVDIEDLFGIFAVVGCLAAKKMLCEVCIPFVVDSKRVSSEVSEKYLALKEKNYC